jgi:hypothetical protein
VKLHVKHYLPIFPTTILAGVITAQAATAQKRYFAHDAVEDSHGVIAPWHRGQNGQIDLRVRVAAEFLKRYPWVGIDGALMAGPHYIFNARVNLENDGAISVLPASDNMNGNLGQQIDEGFACLRRIHGGQRMERRQSRFVSHSVRRTARGKNSRERRRENHKIGETLK